MKDAFRGRWRVVVIAVPVLAAIAAGVWFTSSADDEFEASGVLSITEFSNAETPAEIRAVLDDFDSSLGTREVAEIVRAASPDGEARIQTEPFGEGGDVRITYVAPRADQAELALDAGLREALTIISEAERRQLNRQLSAASALSGDAVEQLRSIEADAGAADLAAEAARRSADLLTLRNQIANAADDPAVRSALVAILEEKEAELALIDEQLLPWTSQRARFDLAVESAAATALRLRQIAANQTDLRDAELLTSTRVVELSSTPDLVRVVVGAAAVAAVVAIAFALLAATQQGRRDDDDADLADVPAARSGTSDSTDEIVRFDPSDATDGSQEGVSSRAQPPLIDRWLAGDGGDPASEIDELLGLYGNAATTSTPVEEVAVDRTSVTDSADSADSADGAAGDRAGSGRDEITDDDDVVDEAAGSVDDQTDQTDETDETAEPSGRDDVPASTGSRRASRKRSASVDGSAASDSSGGDEELPADVDEPELDQASARKPTKRAAQRSRSRRRTKRATAVEAEAGSSDDPSGPGGVDDDAAE